MPVKKTPFCETGDVQSYAIRRVNPFVGVLQVVETNDGRAISTNGVVWNLAVRSEKAGVSDNLSRNNKHTMYYRYGLWSSDEGYVSGPLRSEVEDESLKEQCDVLISCIQERQDKLPFKLIDTLELWLFDSDKQRPIALLASMAPEATRPSPEPKYWVSCLGADGTLGQARFPESKTLEAQVKEMASFNISKYWVTRAEDNSGFVDGLNINLKAADFPPYMVTEDWSDDEQKSLVGEYIKWISPSLLTLQHLSQNQRVQLEKNLHAQAISVEHHWHLYPEVIDEKMIKAARVQSRIQKSQ